MMTVITVDWNRMEFQSVPIRVPCTGHDQIFRLELVVSSTASEYAELQRVVDTMVKRPAESIKVHTFSERLSFIGPQPLGQHYGAMFRENRHDLFQNRTVRLVTITERVMGGQVSQEHHLLRLLNVASHTDSDEETIVAPGMSGSTGLAVNPDHDVGESHMHSRRRRAADVNTKVDAKFDITANKNNEKHGSDNTDSKHLTTGGGYGSQTCTNAVFTAWNNSTFDSGKCGCECPSCPSCETGVFAQLAERADKERTSMQGRLMECQDKLLKRHRSNSPASSLSSERRCVPSEMKRLKEETRNLRARIRRMSSSTQMTEPLPSKSPFVSSMETVGSVLVEGAAQYVTTRRNSMSKGTTTTSVASTTANKMQPSKTYSTNRKNRPSKIPVSTQSRTTSRGTSSIGRTTKLQRKHRRGRRSLSGEELLLGKYHPWMPDSPELNGEHFFSSKFGSRISTGNDNHIFIPRVQEIRTVRNRMYSPTHPHEPKRRGRRDAKDSHFIGSSNQAEIKAFDRASFVGSTENRYDNSSNVRFFRPVVSPRINVNARGKNETLITKSHNGNDIRITNTPCSCEDDFGAIMAAVFAQMVLTVLLTLSICIHYHLHRRASHNKKKDLDLIRMQAHTVYRQNRASQMISAKERKQKALSTSMCLTNREGQLSEVY